MSAEIIEHPSGRRRADDKPERSSARFWMKHDPAKFLMETASVDTEGAGMLIKLRGYYWMNRRLPETDAECARICGVTLKKFRQRRSWLFSFFDADGKCPELDASIEEIERKVAINREAGRRGGISKSLANASRSLQRPPSQLEPEPEKELEHELSSESSSSSPSPPPPRAWIDAIFRTDQLPAATGDKIAAELLATLPVSKRAHPGWRGFGPWIDRLLADGVARADIAVGVFQCLRSLHDEPPKTFRYFAAAIERAREARTRPLPQVGGQHGYQVLAPNTPEWQAEHDRLLDAEPSKAALMRQQAERGHGWTLSTT